MVPFPGLPRGGSVVSEEGDRFAVILVGLLGEEPPTDQEGMEAYAMSLTGPDVAEVVKSATPLDEAVAMRYPASVRHHYEKVGRYLDGFLVVGDALCSFDPIYGQGMTTAAAEALLLQGLLARGTGDLPRRFFRAAAKILNTPWSLSAGGDLRFPQAEGKRQPLDGLLNGYLDLYRRAASVDPVLGRTFLEVGNMLVPPTRLMSPGHMLRVFRGARKGARATHDRSLAAADGR
jgi:2-polyprenyl-6-methoxyphenol hydroxylase-like FAD-dependent oxidoreductase